MDKINEIEQTQEQLTEELLTKTKTKNINNIHDNSLSIGDKIADKIAVLAGSWPFIIGFLSLLVIWIILNTIQVFTHFDEYPFILLNLALSCIAAIQAPIIMMSQNRQEEKDRIRSEQDFETNMKSEIMIEQIFKRVKKIEQLEKKQNEIMELLQNKK